MVWLFRAFGTNFWHKTGFGCRALLQSIGDVGNGITVSKHLSSSTYFLFFSFKKCLHIIRSWSSSRAKWLLSLRELHVWRWESMSVSFLNTLWKIYLKFLKFLSPFYRIHFFLLAFPLFHFFKLCLQIYKIIFFFRFKN